MGFPIPLGENVPAWLVDAAKLGDWFTRLHRALQRPPSFSRVIDPSLLAFDRSSIRDSVAMIADATKSTHVELRQALAGFETHSIDRAHQERLTALVNELTTLWSVRATMTLGFRRSSVLRRLLGEAGPDLLGVLRQEDDENAHSRVLRWPSIPAKLLPCARRSCDD